MTFFFTPQITALFAGKDRLGQRLTVPEYFLCGMFTGAVAALVEGPIDLVSVYFSLKLDSALET